MSWVVWLSLSMSLAGLALWVVTGVLLVQVWRQWKPTLVAAIKMFLPPPKP